jgi:hypothetical protein
VEGVVRAHPFAHDRAARLAGLAGAEILGDPGEVLLGGLERLEILGRHVPGGDLRRERLELGAHHERLVQLLPRNSPDADAAVGDEGDEPERRQPPQSFADRRSRDLELLGQLLLAEDGSRLELAGDDRLLDYERDVVGLGGVERHAAIQD